MTVDFAALAKLASEATPGPWEWSKGGSLRSDEELAYIAAASPDVVAALVRVALAGEDLLRYAPPGWASEPLLVALAAALADLDHD